MEVIGMYSEPKILGLKINQDEPGCYRYSFKHSGDFNLSDYEEIELVVLKVKMVRK